MFTGAFLPKAAATKRAISVRMAQLWCILLHITQPRSTVLTQKTSTYKGSERRQTTE